MAHAGYEVGLYRPEFRSQVVSLLKHLWGGDPDVNLSYFQWKYDDNPYTESPLGIVTLHRGQVVGFRGYFAARFEILGKVNDLIVLCPGDTCVHPDHRQKGLSVAMGNTAMKEYAQKYRILLNLSCTRSSLPGYQRMGFLPIAKKVYLTRCTLLGLVKYILAARENTLLEASRIRFGRFGDILVSGTPRPGEMSALFFGRDRKDDKIRLFQDEGFFQWRFGNQHKKYMFYYLIQGDVATGYVVMGVSPNNQRGYILDYAGVDGQAIREILRYIIKMKHFDILSIYSFCLDDAFQRTLGGLGFRKNSLVRIIERKLYGELPLLIRPVKETYTESDFFIEGVDMRRIENWLLKPICSDAA
jgi:GNAT superfamily N-acetyltransferase